MISAEAVIGMILAMSRFLSVLEQIRDQKSVYEISGHRAYFKGSTFDMNTMGMSLSFVAEGFPCKIPTGFEASFVTRPSVSAVLWLMDIPEWGIDAELVYMNWR